VKKCRSHREEDTAEATTAARLLKVFKDLSWEGASYFFYDQAEESDLLTVMIFRHETRYISLNHTTGE
jgi:hypothetical protein